MGAITIMMIAKRSKMIVLTTKTWAFMILFALIITILSTVSIVFSIVAFQKPIDSPEILDTVESTRKAIRGIQRKTIVCTSGKVLVGTQCLNLGFPRDDNSFKQYVSKCLKDSSYAAYTAAPCTIQEAVPHRVVNTHRHFLSSHRDGSQEGFPPGVLVAVAL